MDRFTHTMTAENLFLIVNIVGGLAVLGGYAAGLGLYPQHGAALWGGVDGTLRTVFTVSMLPAATGYLAFCFYALFQGGISQEHEILGTYWAAILSAIFLISAAIWMPTSIGFIHTGNSYWWIIAIASLWITALSVIALTGTVASTPDLPATFSKYTAITGLAYMTFHCLVLDAIIWVWLFDK